MMWSMAEIERLTYILKTWGSMHGPLQMQDFPEEQWGTGEQIVNITESLEALVKWGEAGLQTVLAEVV